MLNRWLGGLFADLQAVEDFHLQIGSVAGMLLAELRFSQSLSLSWYLNNNNNGFKVRFGVENVIGDPNDAITTQMDN